MRLSTLRRDHKCGRVENEVAVWPAIGREGDPASIGRPGWRAVVPLAVGDLAGLAGRAIDDEQVTERVAPPAQGVVSVSQASHDPDARVPFRVVAVRRSVGTDVRDHRDGPDVR